MVHFFLALAAGAALAFSDPAAAQDEFRQIRLTDKHIEGFLSAQKEMAALDEKAENSATDKVDPKLEAQFEAAAKKHGFKDYAEYETVSDNISMIMAGIDPQTKAFTEPPIAIKKKIQEVQADKSIPADEKKEMLDELRETLEYAQPVQYRENIELVKKNFERLDAALN